MKFDYVQHEYVGHYWPLVEPMLAKAFGGIAHFFDLVDCRDSVFKGDMQLWIAHDDENVFGGVTTSVEEGTQGRFLRVYVLGGRDLPSWVALMDIALSKFGEANECRAIEAITRPGFNHFIPDFVEDGRRFVKVLKEQ